MKSDPRREFISQELHARPYVRFAGPAHVFHFAFVTGDGTRPEDRESLDRLKETLGLEATYETSRHAIHTVRLPRLGRLVVAWERHSEFVAYAFFLYELEIPFRPFGLDARELLPSGFADSVGLPPLVAACLAVFHPRTSRSWRAVSQNCEKRRSSATCA